MTMGRWEAISRVIILSELWTLLVVSSPCLLAVKDHERYKKLVLNSPTYQMSDSLVRSSNWEDGGIIGYGNQLILSGISLMSYLISSQKNIISSLRRALGVFTACVFISWKHSLYWAHISMVNQEDDFELACIILIYRIYTGYLYFSHNWVRRGQPHFTFTSALLIQDLSLGN